MRIFAYTFSKSGSMFLHRYLQALAALTGCAHFSINNQSPNQDGWTSCSGPFVVGPVRLKADMPVVFAGDKSIIHLRNPIDVLISQYYSWGWSHAPQGESFAARRLLIRQKTIDEYCLEASGALAAKYCALKKLHDSFPGRILSDYSAMRGNFRQWNSYLCRAAFGPAGAAAEGILLRKFAGEFSALRRLFHRALRPADIISGKSRAHQRDGRDNQKYRYLRRQTIRRLEQDMQDVLAFFADFQVAAKTASKAVASGWSGDYDMGSSQEISRLSRLGL